MFFKDKYYFHKVLHPDDEKRVKQWWEEESEITSPQSTKIEYRIMLNGNKIKWVEDNRFVGKRIEGKLVNYGIMRDITELKKTSKKRKS
jgi:hypothetical protein